MKHPHTRRLVITALFVSAVGLAATLSVSALSGTARGSGTAGSTVRFYKQSKLLGSVAVPIGSSLDIGWKDGTCSNGYASPPVAFTWTGTNDGVTTAPVMGQCQRVRFPDDVQCTGTIIPLNFECHFTYKSNSGTARSASISNPTGGTVGNLYLYKRTALYAYLITPGKSSKKVSIPAGADRIEYAAG